MPGIVVDRYGDICVVQLNTAGALALRGAFLEALHATIAPKGILLRNAGSTRDLEGIPALDESIGEVPERIVIAENNMRIVAPLCARARRVFVRRGVGNLRIARRRARSGVR